MSSGKTRVVKILVGKGSIMFFTVSTPAIGSFLPSQEFGEQVLPPPKVGHSPPKSGRAPSPDSDPRKTKQQG